LAEKWFGVIEDQMRRTILMDGTDAIHQALSRGEKYNVVLIDACDSRNQKMPCPAKDFLLKTNLAKIKEILEPMGMLISYFSNY
jgi:hypothetical protein